MSVSNSGTFLEAPHSSQEALLSPRTEGSPGAPAQLISLTWRLVRSAVAYLTAAEPLLLLVWVANGVPAQDCWSQD